MSNTLDLGSGRTLRWLCWKPDRALNPQYADIPDVEHYGAIIEHEGCAAAITFDGEVQQRLEPNKPRWTVVSWDPLTLSPSLLVPGCCHGFIRDGKWVDA